MIAEASTRRSEFIDSPAVSLIAVVLWSTAITEAKSSEGVGISAVEEIVVTAQKRPESVYRVGMSIAVYSEDQLTSRGVIETNQLAKIVPGLSSSS